MPDIVTLGKYGCIYVTPRYTGTVEGYEVQVVDTTGAGDGFVAGLLFGVLEDDGSMQDESRLRTICKFANAIGALTTTRRGAIPALPTLKDVQNFMLEYPF